MNNIVNMAGFVSAEFEQILNQIYFAVPNWKWLILIAGIVALYVIRPFFQSFLKSLKSTKPFQSDQVFMNHFLNLEVEKGISWAVLALVGMILVENLELTINMEKYFLILLKVFLAFNVIRVIYLSMDSLGYVIEQWAEKTDSSIDDQLAPLATKTLKVLVILIGFLVVLQNFGVNVTALLAGLGLGGVAIAFAAQDTVANVFGTITILLDSPFKLGDRVKIGDVDGTIEEVGFRSTRIRTLYNSVVTMPNSVVAKEKIDNLTARNNVFRFRTVLGFTYNTTEQQIEQFCQEFKYHLKQDPTVQQDRVTVVFQDFAESSLNVLIAFHYQIPDPVMEADIVQSHLNMIHKLYKKLNLDFAFPTRTVILENKN